MGNFDFFKSLLCLLARNWGVGLVGPKPRTADFKIWQYEYFQ
jgi:hypothetical protein